MKTIGETLKLFIIFALFSVAVFGLASISTPANDQTSSGVD